MKISQYNQSRQDSKAHFHSSDQTTVEPI